MDNYGDDQSRQLAIKNDTYSNNSFKVILCSKFPGIQTASRAEL